jgi:uncharacterized membrane protein YfcA
MNLLIFGIALLITGIFTIAQSSIAIECHYAQTEKFKNDKKNNFNFTIVVLVSAILAVLSGVFGIYAGMRMR